jgi:hypothetical protein
MTATGWSGVAAGRVDGEVEVEAGIVGGEGMGVRSEDSLCGCDWRWGGGERKGLKTLWMKELMGGVFRGVLICDVEMRV